MPGLHGVDFSGEKVARPFKVALGEVGASRYTLPLAENIRATLMVYPFLSLSIMGTIFSPSTFGGRGLG